MNERSENSESKSFLNPFEAKQKGGMIGVNENDMASRS
jgi:hypothetical protein